MKHSYLIIVFLTAILGFGCSDQCNTIEEHHYIAHAGGEVEGFVYTNSKEAVANAISNGIQYIELDLGLTKDSVLVAIHDWEYFREITNNYPVSLEPLNKQEFMNSKIFGKYTPLVIENILEILNDNPDIKLVTDKISDYNIIDKYFKGYENRIIVECFTLDDYVKLQKSGYTCFMSSDPPFFLKYLLKKMINHPGGSVDKYVTSIERYETGKKSHDINILINTSQQGIIALFTGRNRAQADSLFKKYPEVKFIYIDNVEKE